MNAPPSGEFTVHQEGDAVASRAIVIAGAVAFFVGALAVGAAWLLLDKETGAVSAPAPGAAPRAIANVEQTPILEARDGLDLRARQEAELHAWGWANRDAGLATIPIERAMDLVVDRGSR